MFINHSSDNNDAGSGGEDDGISEFIDYSSNSDDDICSDHESSTSEEDDDSSESSSSTSSSGTDYSDEYEDFYSVKHEHYVLDKHHENIKNKMWEDFEDFTVNLMRCFNTAELDSFRLHIGDRRRAPQSASWQAAAWLRRAMKQRTPSDPAGPGKGLSSGSWRIKRLHIGNVLLDSRFAEHVRSVCRCLEDLELDDCTCEIQSITSHSLKTLVLRKCTWSNLSKIASPTLKTLVFDGGSNAEDCMLVIMAPAIAYLQLAVKVYEGFEGGITMDEMPSLAKASIYLGEHYYDAGSKLVANHFNLLCSVSHATSLELSCIRKKVLGKEPRFQEFKNLRNLLLGNCNLSNNFRTLTFFLQSSPNLESLTLRRCKFPKYHKKKKGKPKHDKTSSSEFLGLDFLCENLEVEIIYKDGDARQLVKLLLRATGNLLKNHIKLTRVVN